MADPTIVSGPISGTESTLSFETGKLALQSQGAVVATIGGTTVLATANAATGVREGIDFFPLTVDVEERAYAAGKIPGSFFRREGRPTEQAILTCRLIDRPLRPSFPDGFRNETQVVITVLGADQENPHDVLAINAASAALMLSGIPFDGPIGAVRMAYSQDGAWMPHPTYSQGDESTFELVVAGRELADGDVAIMMVEAGGTEKANTLLRGRRAEGDRGGHRRRPRGGQDLDQGEHRPPARARGQGRRPPDAGLHAGARLRRRRVGGRARPPARRRWPRPSPSRPRRSATPPSTRPPPPSSPSWPARPTRRARFAGRQKEIKEAMRALTKKLVRKRVVERGHAHRRPRRPRPPAAVGRGGRAAHGPRLGPVPAGRDPGAHRHHAGHAPHEPDARHDRSGHDQALHAPLQHGARGPTARPAASARRSAARSATAPWPSGPCCPSCPARRSSPTRSGWCPRCCRRTAPRRWRRCAPRRCR